MGDASAPATTAWATCRIQSRTPTALPEAYAPSNRW